MSNISNGVHNEIIDNNINDLIGAFLSGRKASTIKSYSGDLQSFSAFIKVAGINEAARVLLSSSAGEANALAFKYRAFLINELNLQPASVNRKLAALRSLVKLGTTFGIVNWELQIENQQHVAYRDTKGVGEDKISLLLKSLKAKRDPKSIRDYAILRLLFDLGLRREELCQIEIADLNLNESSLMILGKGRLQKEKLDLPTETVEAIKLWLKIRGVEPGALFFRLDKAANAIKQRLTGTGLYSVIKHLGAINGLKGMTVHKIRHSAITAACKAIAESNLGLETILKFSRHKNLNTALIYMDHLKNDQGELARLVARKAG